MTTPGQTTENQSNSKELNFRALEAKYQKELAQERSARLEAERMVQERNKFDDSDDDTSDPYIDHKKLEKKLARHGEQTQKQTQTEIQKAVHTAIHEERKNNWIKSNPDFYDTLQYAEKLAQQDPELAESILEMPESFERQKLVYKNIKALGLHKEPAKSPSIQEKIDSNKRSPYYQPSSVGSAPYQSVGDFSQGGQKQAYDKMQELKARLRI